MHMAYLIVTVVAAAMVGFSGIAKVRRDPKVVHVIQEVVGVPPKYFLLLAGCEFAGSLVLIFGIWLPWIGVAAGAGVVIYFIGAVVSHLRVGDVKGIGPASFMLVIAGAALALRVLTDSH